jgi:hypothetical protein
LLVKDWKAATWLGNALMDVKISKLPEFPICGQGGKERKPGNTGAFA